MRLRSSGIKTEAQKERAIEFKKLAAPLVGDGEDVLADVVRWLRGLMRIA